MNIDDEINDVLSGYFLKVVNSFFDGKYKQMILDYFFNSLDHSENLIKHIYCRSISELLTKFLNFSALEMPESRKNSFSYGGGGRMLDFRQTITSGDKFSSLTQGQDDDAQDQDLEFESEETKKAKEKVTKLNELMLGLRIKIFKDLINRLLASTDLQVIGNITSIFSNFLENYKDVDSFCPIFTQLFFDDKEVLEVLFSCVCSRGLKMRKKVCRFEN